MEVVEVMAREAKRRPTKEQNFRRRYLNQQVAANASLISRADWAAWLPAIIPSDRSQAAQFELGERLYGGLDLSTRTDLTALVMGSNTSTSTACAPRCGER